MLKCFLKSCLKSSEYVCTLLETEISGNLINQNLLICFYISTLCKPKTVARYVKKCGFSCIFECAEDTLFFEESYALISNTEEIIRDDLHHFIYDLPKIFFFLILGYGDEDLNL